MSSIKLILRTDKVNKNTGEAPIYIRIIKNRVTKFIATGIKLDPKHWNEAQQKVRKSYKNSERLNAFLSEKASETENKILEETSKNRDITTKDLKEAIIGKEPPKFFEYAFKRLETLKNNISLTTYINYNRYLNKFSKFAKNPNLYFQDITVTYLKDYEHFIRNTQKNSNSSAEFAFKIVKIFFNHAISEDLISYDNYPFRKYNIKRSKSTKTYLNEQQFNKLLEYQPEPQEVLIKDIFVFSCYGGGLRFFDLFELKWENYNAKEQKIFKKIHKTSRSHQIKLPAQAIEILEKYHSEGCEPNDYIFGLVEKNKTYTERQYLRVKENKNKNLNKKLKELGKKLEIPFPLTFHVARHTFATLALKLGMRIEYVSKILDHSDIQTTQVYAKIINKELDDAMDNIFQKK